MIDCKYINQEQIVWVEEHPHDAFKTISKITKEAEQALYKNNFKQAIPLLGKAYETAAIIFDNRLESPQLTTCLTSTAIMLAHAYSMTGKNDNAYQILRKLKTKMQYAIECANGYATKVAYFKHCSEAITEASHDISAALLDNKKIVH